MKKKSDDRKILFELSPAKHKSNSYLKQKLFCFNLAFILLFIFISIISLTFLIFLNNLNESNNKNDFINLEPSLNISIIKKQLEPHFDSEAKLYHLAQNQFEELINHNYQKLETSGFFCSIEGTDWIKSTENKKCICKENYSFSDCGFDKEIFKTKILDKQLSCDKTQDFVKIKRLSKPSKLILAMPLYECSKRNCNNFILDVFKEYKSNIDLFIFLEVEKKNLSQSKLINNDELHLYNNSDKIIYWTQNFENLNFESIEVTKKIYQQLWDVVFFNVTNFRPSDKIIFLPPFKKTSKKLTTFFKFYEGFGEPILLTNDFSNYSSLPQNIQDDLNEIESGIMLTFQYALSVCQFKHNYFFDNYCLNNKNLVKNFEINYWDVCKKSAIALH